MGGSPPNLIVIVADDLGWGEPGYHGGPIPMPAIDRLAAEGVRLEAFYAEPFCSPTRAALLTGRYPHRFGLQLRNVPPWSTRTIPPDQKLLPERLLEAGYRTAIVGKWHLGCARPELLPGHRGFQRQYGPYTGMIDYDTHRWKGRVLDWYHDGVPVEEEGYATDLIAAEAVRLIHEWGEEGPFFLYVAFTAPHGPYDRPPRHVPPFTAQDDPCEPFYSGMLACLDEGIGSILDALEHEGLRERTLVVFVSDNGAPQDPIPHRRNRPFHGGKGSTREGGIRVPAVLSWPGMLPEGVVDERPYHVVDLTPTLLDVAGVSHAGAEFDGIDLWPILFEDASPPPRDLVFCARTPREALRRGDLKLLVEDGVPALFDLAKDPFEEHDLSESLPGALATLLRSLERHRAQAAPRSTADHERVPEQYPATWAPADPEAGTAEPTTPSPGR